MESMMDYKEEEEVRHARRVQRAEEMKREKKLQEKRRQMIRHYVPLGLSVIGVIILLIIGITAVVKRPDKDMIPLKQVAEDTQISTDLDAAVTDIICVGMDDEKQSGEAKQRGATGNSVSEKVPLYSFSSNEDTITILSEKVVSTNVILVNEGKDVIVASKGAKERINPASMTKVLTVLVAAEQITEADLDDTFVMTKEITDYAYVNDCSSVGFLDGEKVTVRDLFYGTVLPSGGDAAVGLATYIAGSHEVFVELMNKKLKELGLSESAHFTNCVGLFDEEHYCTVYDMAVIMKAAVNNELCREFLSAKRYTTAPTTEHPEGISISNWFLRRIEDKDAGGEVLCAKTGYVVESKNCAVSYGTFAGDTPYICVTAGASSSWRCIYEHVEIYNGYVQKGE